MRWCEENGKKLSDKELTWLMDAYLMPEDMKWTEGRFTIEQGMNYLIRQKKESYPTRTFKGIIEQYRDYMAMCKRLKNDNMQTAVPSIYAIGDVNGRCMLAHAATAHGMCALSAIKGKPCAMKLNIVPSAVFTTPEMSMVGLTEEQCKAQELDVTVKKGMFRSNGKALAMGETEGLVKIIVDNATRQILGCHICGPHAADLIQEVVMAMNAEATIDTLASSIHGHPTLSEVILSTAHQF